MRLSSLSGFSCYFVMFSILLILLISTSPAYPDDKKDYSTPWHTLIKTESIGVYVERAIYQKADDKIDNSAPIFFHFKIENISGNNIWLDLRDFRFIFYPNQLGITVIDERAQIDEMRRMMPQLGKYERESILKAFQQDQLKILSPREHFDYYRSFNGNGREFIEHDKAKGKFLIVSMDGVVMITDGETVESIDCSESYYSSHLLTDVVFPLPLQWRQIPVNAFVIEGFSSQPIAQPH